MDNPQIVTIKEKYKELEVKFDKLRKESNLQNRMMREILDAEKNVNVRKEIIDFVYADEIEPVVAYAFRKIYLKELIDKA